MKELLDFFVDWLDRLNLARLLVYLRKESEG